MKTREVLRPSVFFLVPLVGSISAWLIPGESYGLRGFQVRSEMTVSGGLLLLGWYGTCLVFLGLGYRVGRSIPILSGVQRVEQSETFARTFYLVLTMLSTLGVGYAVFVVQQNVSILASLSSSSGNELTESIGGVAGLATLRYTSAVAAPVGLYLWRYRRGAFGLALWNSLLLAVNALFSSRLSLILAITIFLVLVLRLEERVSFRPRTILLAGAAAFGALGILNYLRNANFYVGLGVDNPILMNTYQMIAYLGVPFQVALGSATGIMAGSFPSRGDAADATEVLIPTFFRSGRTDPGLFDPASSYLGNADVARNFNTNSAFADTYASYGWWGLLYVLVAITLAAVLFGHASQFKSVAAVTCGIIAYGLAESWRVFLFNQGIIVYLLLAVALASAIAAMRANREILRLPAGLMPRKTS